MFDATERQFIREILADPRGNEPRLVYADWLEERGDVRAQALRIGVQLEQRQSELFFGSEDVLCEQWERQLRNLRVDYSAACRKHLPQIEGVKWRQFDDGVIHQVQILDALAFARRAGEILDVQPIHRLEFKSDLENLESIFDAPELDRVGALYLGDNHAHPNVARAVATSPHIANLRCLNLDFTHTGDEGAAYLAGAAHLSTLRELSLRNTDLTDEGLRALCVAQQFAEIESLVIGWNALGGGAADALRNGPFRALRRLDLHSNENIESSAFKSLMESPMAKNLTWLDISHNKFDHTAGEALFSGPALGLRRVNLVGNHFGESVVAALSGAALPQLCELRIELYGPCGPKTADDLAGASWLSNIETLAIRDHGALKNVGPAIAQASLDRLEEMSWLCLGSDAWSHRLDYAIQCLADNGSLRNLKVLVLHAPLTRQALEPLSKMASLLVLRVPKNLESEIDQLRQALPACDVAATTYVRED